MESCERSKIYVLDAGRRTSRACSCLFEQAENQKRRRTTCNLEVLLFRTRGGRGRSFVLVEYFQNTWRQHLAPPFANFGVECSGAVDKD
jgi:hypothetical protein